MPAQLEFVLYFLLSVVVFPFAAINFFIIKTPILPQLHSFAVTSGSMSPAVPKGSLIYAVGEKNYKKGDVITFSDSIGNVTHRIKGEVVIGHSKYFVTQGDANNVEDNELVPVTSVYGKVVMVLPGFGNAILILRKLSV